MENLSTFVRTLGNQFIKGRKVFVDAIKIEGTLIDGTSAVGTSGQVLSTTETGIQWITVGSSDVGELNDLTDVIISTASTGQLLRFDGESWVNWTHDFLGGVSILSPTSNQFIKYNGTNWVNAEVLLSELGDTSISSPSADQILAYGQPVGGEPGVNIWYNKTPNYLTSYTETDPVYTGSSWYTTANNATNWDTAYGWGDHEGLYSLIDHTHNVFTQATSEIVGGEEVIVPGSNGFVPASGVNDDNKFLRSDGTWQVATTDLTSLSDVTIDNPQAGDFLIYDDSSGEWINSTISNYSLPIAGASLGGVKSGTDISVDESGNVSVLDDSHTHDLRYLQLTGGTLTGDLVTTTISDSVYKNAGSSSWITKKYIRSVGLNGAAIGDAWVRLARVVIDSTYRKVNIKLTINGYDDVSSGTEVIDGLYENSSTAQENHSFQWYSTDNNANLFKQVRSIRSTSSGLNNVYDIWVQMAGDWRDDFTVLAEYWLYGGTVTFVTDAGTATEPTAGSDDKNLTNRTWITQNSYMYLGGNRILTTADEGTGNGLDADTLDGNHASAFAASSHTHNDIYYTETEVDALLSGKADAEHTHEIGDINELQDVLDRKLEEESDTLDSVTDRGATTTNTITVGGALISASAPLLDFVDTNSFTDVNDRFRIRAVADAGRIQWYDSSASSTLDLMHFSLNGNVGIGTTSPGAKLEVFGTGNTLRLDSAANGSKEILFRNVGTGTATIKTDGDLKLYVEDAGKNILFDTTGGEKMRITAAGNVGIGTTAPSTALDVGDGQISGVDVIYGDSGGSLLLASYDKSSLASSYIGLYTANGTASGERMRIDPSGNVGIGTTSPGYKLEVAGNAAFTGSRPVFYDTGGGNFQIKASSGGWAMGYFFQGSSGTSKGGWGALGGDDSLSYLWAGDAYNTPTMIVQGGQGNVGIGTTSPSYKLDVNGSFNATSVNVTNNITTSAGNIVLANDAGIYSFSDTVNTDADEAIFRISNLNGAQAFRVSFVCNTSGYSVAKTYEVVHAFAGTPVAFKVVDTGPYGSEDFDVTFANAATNTGIECSITNNSSTVNANIVTTIFLAGSTTSTTITEL